MPDWLTYAEIGKRFGLGTEAARTRVRRLGWRTQPGNDGRTLALVPEDADLRPGGDRVVRPDSDREHSRPVTGPIADLLAGALAALEDAVQVLREQLERSEASREQERARADRAEQGRDGERQRADDLRDRLNTMQEQLADAHAALQTAETADAWAKQAWRDKERAEAGRDAERARADALRDRIEALQEQLAARQEGVAATETLRQAEAMVDSLREAHTGEISTLKTERHRLATQIDGFATRADQAEARTDSLRARVDVLQGERDTARAEAQEAAETNAARKARGLVARLRAAWRGE